MLTVSEAAQEPTFLAERKEPALTRCIGASGRSAVVRRCSSLRLNREEKGQKKITVQNATDLQPMLKEPEICTS